MDRIFMFDIDGTLTPSRLQMTEKFSKYFDKWSKRNKYLCFNKIFNTIYFLFQSKKFIEHQKANIYVCFFAIK